MDLFVANLPFTSSDVGACVLELLLELLELELELLELLELELLELLELELLLELLLLAGFLSPHAANDTTIVAASNNATNFFFISFSSLF